MQVGHGDGLARPTDGNVHGMSRSDALSTLSHLADKGARLSRDVRLPEVRLPDIDLSDLPELPDVRLPDVRLPDVSAPDLSAVTDSVRRRPSWVAIGVVGLVAALGIVWAVRRRRSSAEERSADLASVA